MQTDSVVIAVRTPSNIHARILTIAETMQARAGGAHVSKSVAVNVLIARGLDEIEKEFAHKSLKKASPRKK
jgi:hypothetical protein